jgi:hypothetical protein
VTSKSVNVQVFVKMVVVVIRIVGLTPTVVVISTPGTIVRVADGISWVVITSVGVIVGVQAVVGSTVAVSDAGMLVRVAVSVGSGVFCLSTCGVRVSPPAVGSCNVSRPDPQAVNQNNTIRDKTVTRSGFILFYKFPGSQTPTHQAIFTHRRHFPGQSGH